MNQEPMNAHAEMQATSPTEPPTTERTPLATALLDYLDIFAWSIFGLLLLFTFAFRICNVEGRSMEDTLQNRQTLILSNIGYTPEQDDIVVFHLANSASEKTLVKRVIATENQVLEINFKTGVITVDGKIYADEHAVFKDRFTGEIIGRYNPLGAEYDYNVITGIFRTTVPEGKIFVMGDNRNNSRDSRDPSVGFVDERWVLGKVILRLSPYTVFS